MVPGPTDREGANPGTMRPSMQTRYLILAALLTGLAILAAGAFWFLSWL